MARVLIRAKKMTSVPILEAKKMTAKKTVLRVRVQLRKDGECSKTAKKRPKSQSLDENGVFLTLNEECRHKMRIFQNEDFVLKVHFWGCFFTLKTFVFY